VEAQRSRSESSSTATVGAVEELTEESVTFVRHLVDPKGKTGSFWQFDKVIRPHSSSCTLCQTDISIKGRTTTGLNKHLRHKHREQYE
jgi:hypothetical protein